MKSVGFGVRELVPTKKSMSVNDRRRVNGKSQKLFLFFSLIVSSSQAQDSDSSVSVKSLC